jgi:4-aminobutyrate aminotransferase-like enzyme
MAMRTSSLEPVATTSVSTAFRRIQTAIPAPESIAPIQQLRSLETRSMSGMPPILWNHAEGFQVSDPYGNQWIDFTSGIVAANTGHANPRVMKAIAGQVEKSLAFTYAFPSMERSDALTALLSIAPPTLDKAILFSSGTEATECALMIMRRRGMAIEPVKRCILGIEGSYHGRTLGARLAGGAHGPVDGVDRALAGNFLLPFPGSESSKGFRNDVDALGIDPATVAGILFESIPGWSTTPHPVSYIMEMMNWTREHDVLVACDEVQAGMGRTGRWFAFEHYGISPDLIACGKGLTGCLPASAVIGHRSTIDLCEPGEMSSTFGGNPLTSAAVAATIAVLRDERLVERSACLGQLVGERLRRIASRHPSAVERCDGRGLFYSLHFRDAAAAEAITMECIRRGVMLFLTGRAFLKVTPPLIIEETALAEGLDVIASVVDDYFRED